MARLLSMVERGGPDAREVGRQAHPRGGRAYTVGITGSPGAGKSTLTNALCSELRAGSEPRAGDPERVAVLAIDPSSPFSGGAILGEAECRGLLHRHMGEEAAWAPSLLARATRKQILIRMLLNLKRLYVRMRSFPQARQVTDILLALQPSSLAELRDRGLLAYHMNDVYHALKDLEAYLKIARLTEQDEEQRKETEQVWEHVKTLRRRAAQMN